MKQQLKRYFNIAIKPMITILIALVIGGVLILSAGESPFHAYYVLFDGAFGSVNSILGTLAKATPLIFTGLAAALASRAGVFNIGIEGQLYMGAMAAALVGIYCGTLPAFILIPLCFLGAMAASVLWALIPGLLNSKLKINIFIMFFMLNNMALLFTEYLANGPFQGDIPAAVTEKIAPGAKLYRFSNYSDLNTGFIIALIVAALVYFLMFKTKFGYECGALGKSRTFSQYIGIHVKSKTLLVLTLSAMISGLAGAEQVMGFLGRFYAGFSNELGFTGISIALLADDNPLGVIIFAIFFGALNSGGLQMAASTNVPSDIINVLQSIMIILISADFAIKLARRSKQAKLEVAQS